MMMNYELVVVFVCRLVRMLGRVKFDNRNETWMTGGLGLGMVMGLGCGKPLWRHKNSRLLQRPSLVTLPMVAGYCHQRTTEKRFLVLSRIPSLLRVLCAFCVVTGEAKNKKDVELWSLGLEFVGHALLLRKMLLVVHPQRRYG